MHIYIYIYIYLYNCLTDGCELSNIEPTSPQRNGITYIYLYIHIYEYKYICIYIYTYILLEGVSIITIILFISNNSKKI
jgi:hypothetical protein